MSSSLPTQRGHLGLGDFIQAHQGWYAQHAEDGAVWSYAFAGRSPGLAETLAAQDGRSPLLTRGAQAYPSEVFDGVATAHLAAAHDHWLAELACPEVAVTKITVTATVYPRSPHGAADHTDPQLNTDIDVLDAGSAPGTTVLARLVAGLLRVA